MIRPGEMGRPGRWVAQGTDRYITRERSIRVVHQFRGRVLVDIADDGPGVLGAGRDCNLQLGLLRISRWSVNE